jgi:general secretion pathway protein I
MAAIMLMAIAFTALLKVAGASTALTQNAANHSAAAMWARSMLDSAFVDAPPRVGHSSGRFDRKFTWQLDVTPWVDTGVAATPEPLQLYQLDLEVSWGPGGHARSAHFRTLHLAMAQRGSGSGGVP